MFIEQPPQFIRQLYPRACWRMSASERAVYLTFDDGPIPECTPQVLDILAQYNVKATFFMVAENAERYPELTRRVVAEGHTIGNHTYHHMRGHQSMTRKYVEDALRGERVLKTKLFRPPHGRMKASQKWAILEAGYTIYLWDVLTHDYNPRYSVESILSAVQHYTRNGSIIVLHDSLKSKDRMLEALPLIIEWLQKEGYQLKALAPKPTI